MFIEINKDLILYVKQIKNTQTPRYIQQNLNKKCMKLFKKITKYYQNIYGGKKYFNPMTKTHVNVVSLTPNDFYDYAQKFDKYRPLMTKTVYDSYQIYNMFMLEEIELNAVEKNWIQTSQKNAKFHNIGKNGYVNKKYLKRDAKNSYLEAIYDEEGMIVLDGVNDGTYNHYNNICHLLDLIWWIAYGVYGKNKLNSCSRLKTILISSIDTNLIYNMKIS